MQVPFTCFESADDLQILHRFSADNLQINGYKKSTHKIVSA